MAEFRGFKCDECGAIIADPDQRTIKRVRFEGPTLTGDYRQDLCPDCTPAQDGLSLKPIQRRNRTVLTL